MLKSEELQIDGHRFITTQFAAMRSFTLLGKLAKSIGPALGVLSTADPQQNLASLAPALAHALQGLDPDHAAKLAVEVLANTDAITPGGKVTLSDQDAMNTVFNGKLGMMFKVLAFAVKVNFGDFMAGSGASAAPKDQAPAK